jgi:HAD superfamily hydrolase (TIGR01509 family)
LFGMGDVLYDDTLWRRWFLQLVRRLRVQTNYRAFWHVWDRDYLGDVYRGQRDFCEAFRAFLQAMGLSRAQTDELEVACQARRRQFDLTARPLPGVKTTLQRLHAQGTVLGVLSDSEHCSLVLQDQLIRFGLGGKFAVVLSSIDLGKTKPDPFCYRTALRGMQLLPEEVAFVGRTALELGGAARVGMRTVAFNFEPDASADLFLARFEDLLAVVASRSTLAAAG